MQKFVAIVTGISVRKKEQIWAWGCVSQLRGQWITQLQSTFAALIHPSPTPPSPPDMSGTLALLQECSRRLALLVSIRNMHTGQCKLKISCHGTLHKLPGSAW